MKCYLAAAAAALALAAPAAALADPAADAIGRYVAWRGGPAFEKARGILVRGTTDNGRFQGVIERRVEPGRLMERITQGSAVTHRAIVGMAGWTVTLSGQVEDAGEAAAKEAERRRLTTFDDALRSSKAKVSLEAGETFDGKTVQVLRVTFDPASRYDLLLDPASGALIADRTTEEGATTITRFDDWRMVEGVRVPFRQVQRTEDGTATTLALTEVDIDPAPAPAAYKRPASRRLYTFPAGRAHTDPLAFELFAGTRINIPATVNGVPAPVMLDSGAETTVLDNAFAESLGIKPTAVVDAVGTGGRDVAELASGVTIKVGDVELRDMTVALLDLKPIAAAIGRPLPVVLGKEVLNALTVQLDFADKTITFHDPARFKPEPGAVAVPVSNVSGLHAIPASIEGGKPVLMDFDLGNGQPLLVFPSYWKPQGMLADRPTSKGLSGAVGGIRPRTVASVKTLTIAGVTLRDIPAVFGDEDNSAFNTGHTSGNIGMPILGRFDVTTDYSRGRLLLKPRADAIGAPFPKDRSGLLTRMSGGVATLGLVPEGSPAALAGLKVGQQITALNGKPVSELGVPGITALRNGPAGVPLKVTLSTGETVELVLKDYF
ncbi:aspartyl protease family protein [Phenylobacterium sp.]|uniref:aspartyl protease family protein n=1 Tax=Phenylobacterium sp. TaxID=1871053 RepID=UPI0025DE627F|nr:aspartyl protease family protein [Phenylobacterium sp.]